MNSIANRINRISGGAIATAALVLLVGCQTPPQLPFGAGTTTRDVSGSAVRDCDGRASIAISRFDNKAPGSRRWFSQAIGDGMADQLTTALVSTKCFRVVDRQNIKAVFEELGLQHQSGAVDPSTASRIGKLVGADLLVTAAITEFEENVSGSRSRAQSTGNKLENLASIFLNSDSAHMAVDIRVTDVQTGEIVSASAVEGRARDVAGGVTAALFGQRSSIGGALSSWDKEPRGKALRVVISNAVVALSEDIPREYFKYNRIGRSASIRSSLPSGDSQLARKVQRMLKELGLYDGVIDGKLGPKSSAALSQFQADFDLEVTGRLDSATVKKVNELSN